MQRFEHAARAVGWNGDLVPDVDVLGARFTAVARLRPEVHRWRTDHGWAPELDPHRFRPSADAHPHDQVPVAAVDLVGILVPVSRARHALRACGTLMTLAPCTVVLPPNYPYRAWSMLELDYYGIGVVSGGQDDPAELVVRPEDRSAEFGSSTFGRWLLEVLYSRLLEHDRECTENPT